MSQNLRSWVMPLTKISQAIEEQAVSQMFEQLTPLLHKAIKWAVACESGAQRRDQDRKCNQEVSSVWMAFKAKGEIGL